MMKVRKPNVLKQIYAKFLTQAEKKHSLNFETNIEFFVYFLKLKGITKFNVIITQSKI